MPNLIDDTDMARNIIVPEPTEKDLLSSIQKMQRMSEKKTSNISSTMSVMKKSMDKVEMDIEEISATGGKEIAKSTRSILTKLGYTIDNLTKGVKNITIETARATKDAVSQYGKAISEDVSVNKENVIAMALSRSSPIFGYFASKFIESGIFQKGLSRIKSMFKRKEGIPDNALPHMQHGGYVKEGGLARLHAAEVVMPIDSLLERIDEKYQRQEEESKKKESVTLDSVQSAFKMWQGQSLKMSARAIQREKQTSHGLLSSFLSGFKENMEINQLPAIDRIAEEVRLLRESVLENNGIVQNLARGWRTMLYEHPMFRTFVSMTRNYISAISLPFKILFRRKGNYIRDLPRPTKNVFQNISGILAASYVHTAAKLDTMIQQLNVIIENSGGKAVSNKKVSRLSIAGLGIKQLSKPIELAVTKLLPKSIASEFTAQRKNFRDSMRGMMSIGAKTTMLMLGKLPGVGKYFGLKEKVEPVTVLSLTKEAVELQQGTKKYLIEEHPRAVGDAVVSAMAEYAAEKGGFGKPGLPSSQESMSILVDLRKESEKNEIARFEKSQDARLTLKERLTEKLEAIKAKSKTFIDKITWLPFMLIGFFKNRFMPFFTKVFGPVASIAKILGKKTLTKALTVGGKAASLAKPFLGKTVTGIKGLGAKAGTYLSPLAGKAGAAFSKLGYFGPAALLAAGLAMGGVGAYKGSKKAGEWLGEDETGKVSIGKRIMASVAGFLGGTDSGFKGAAKGVAKGAMLGAGIGGLITGPAAPIGAAIGGAVGAVAGGLLGFVGGKNIAKAMAFIGKHVKKVAISIWGGIKYIFSLPGKGIVAMAKIITEKWKETQGSFPVKMAKMAYWIFTTPYRLVSKGVKWLGDYIWNKWSDFSTKIAGPTLGRTMFKLVSWPVDASMWLVGKGINWVKEKINWENIKEKYKPIFSIFDYIGNLLKAAEKWTIAKLEKLPGVGNMIRWWRENRELSIKEKAIKAKEEIKTYTSNVDWDAKKIALLEKAGMTKEEAIRQYDRLKSTGVETFAQIKRWSDSFKRAQAKAIENIKSEYSKTPIDLMPASINKTETARKAAEIEIIKMQAESEENKKLRDELKEFKNTILQNTNNIINNLSNSSTNVTSTGGGGGSDQESSFSGGPRSNWTQLVLEGEL